MTVNPCDFVGGVGFGGSVHACVPSLTFAGVRLLIACVFVGVVNLPGLEFFS